MKLLEGKTAVITGATRGIGKAIATCFAEHGSNVVFTYYSSEKEAKELEEKLNEFGIRALSFKSDAAKIEDASKLIADTLSNFPQIDIIVNNAGITKDNLLMRISEEDWDNVINTNLKSVYNITKSVQRTMLKQRFGSIINLSSIVGLKGNAGQANYAASKAGIIGFTKSIALELGSRNIRCNAVAPGFIETEMTKKLDENVVQSWRESIPLKRGGQPLDVAQLCLFLASDMSNYITGQVINVDGGMLT